MKDLNMPKTRRIPGETGLLKRKQAVFVTAGICLKSKQFVKDLQSQSTQKLEWKH